MVCKLWPPCLEICLPQPEASVTSTESSFSSISSYSDLTQASIITVPENRGKEQHEEEQIHEALILTETENERPVEDWKWSLSLGSLSDGPSTGGENCWSEASPHLFPVRSVSYLRDKVKQPSDAPLMHLAAVDWLRSSQGGNKIDHIVSLGEDLKGTLEREAGEERGEGRRGERRGQKSRPTPVQVARERFKDCPPHKRPFFFIVNLQVRG